MNRFFLLALALACAPLANAITLGQVDDFQDGTLMDWTGGDNMINVGTGGPGGAGDRYLQLQSFGGSGGGSRLATFNADQWAGNWLTSGVTDVSMYLRNEGQTDLQIRIVFFDLDGDQTRWTSTVSQSLAVGSGWQFKTFSVRQADLTQVMGGNSYAGTMADVDRFMVRHQAGAPNAEGDPIAAMMGMDNVRAVPEPATLIVLGLGATTLMARRRKRN